MKTRIVILLTMFSIFAIIFIVVIVAAVPRFSAFVPTSTDFEPFINDPNQQTYMLGEPVTKIYNKSSPTKINTGIYGTSPETYTGSSLTPESNYTTITPNKLPMFDTKQTCADSCALLYTPADCNKYNGSKSAPKTQCEDRLMKCKYNEKKSICQYRTY